MNNVAVNIRLISAASFLCTKVFTTFVFNRKLLKPRTQMDTDMMHMQDMHDMHDMHENQGPATKGKITEFSPEWDSPFKGSTHEVAISRKFIFVTGQNMNKIAKFDYSGNLLGHYVMPW